MSEHEEVTFPETMEIVLATPIIIGNKPPVTSLTLREPTSKEVRQAEQFLASMTPEAARVRDMQLVSLVSGHSIVVIEQLPISKLREAVGFLNHFIIDGPATGSERPSF